ncbi:hypothetical protein MBRA1_000878 [Malassezia brasiliensis]|uniref:MHD domain-containing protein n=1 Tax=Malassezia brasiliensis TaxID=1821822 RepID=A0AAF0DRF2_9BASI|nr:hypothetical protein MBRA1_000878 [Malassezia brasiliensis]
MSEPESSYASVFVPADPRISVQALQTRLKNARIFHEQIADYFSARREAEEAYVRQLQKITKRSFLSDTTYLPPEYRGVYDRLVSELAEVAQIHGQLERRIMRECEQPLRDAPSSGEWASLRRYDDTLAPILKELNSLESQLHKDQKKFESKRTGAQHAKLEATQEALTQAVNQWDQNVPLAVQAYERVDRARLTMLRETVRQFSRAQNDMAKALYDLSGETGHAASQFNVDHEMLTYVDNIRLPERSRALASTVPPAPQSPTAVETSQDRAPSHGMNQRPTSSHVQRWRDPWEQNETPMGRASPRFSVPLPSALLHHSTSPTKTPIREHGMRDVPSPIPSQLTPGRGTMYDLGAHAAHTSPDKSMASQAPFGPRRVPLGDDEAAARRSARRTTTHLTQVPSLPDSQEEEAAWERMRTQLRNSSLGMPVPVSRRREYRNSSVPTINPRGQSPPVEELRGLQQTSETATPAPPMMSAFSPATISTTHMSPTVHAVPLSVRILERVNVMWVGGALTRIMVVGEIRLSMHAAGPASGRARIQLTHTDQLEKVASHPDVLAQVPEVPHVFELDLAELSRADNNIVALRYQLQTSPDTYAQWAPIYIEPQWRCEPQQSSLLLSYRVNAESQLAARAPHAALQAVSFAVSLPHDTPVSGAVLSQPVGDWDPSAQQLHWERPTTLPLDDTTPNKILARFPLAAQGTPQPVSASWQLPAHTLSDVSIEALTGEQAVVFADIHRETVAGKYFAQP